MKMRFTPLKSFICSLFLGFHQALACEIELVAGDRPEVFLLLLAFAVIRVAVISSIVLAKS